MTVIEQVINEVQLATAKFPTWPTDPLHALAVLGEEYGELNKAMLQIIYEPHKASREEIRKEAIQTAAMALRLVMSLDRYVYRRCPQHEQGSLETQASDGALAGDQPVCGVNIDLVMCEIQDAKKRHPGWMHDPLDAEALFGTVYSKTTVTFMRGIQAQCITDPAI